MVCCGGAGACGVAGGDGDGCGVAGGDGAGVTAGDSAGVCWFDRVEDLASLNHSNPSLCSRSAV